MPVVSDAKDKPRASKSLEVSSFTRDGAVSEGMELQTSLSLDCRLNRK